jgi:hypothetical protein
MRLDGVRPEALEFGHEVRRKGHDSWVPAHLCRRRGSLADVRGRDARFVPGDLVVATGKGPRLLRSREIDLVEIRSVGEPACRAAVAEFLEEEKLAPTHAALFVAMVARQRLELSTPGDARRLATVASEVQVGAKKKSVSELNEIAGRSALVALVADWDALCRRRTRHDTRKAMIRAAAEIVLKKEAERLKSRIEPLRSRIASYKPFASWPSALWAAGINLATGRRGPGNAIFVSPAAARREIASAARQGRGVVATRKALIASASGRGIDMSHPTVAAVVNGARPSILAAVKGMPQGFSLKDAVAAQKLVRTAELVMDQVQSLTRAREATLAHEARQRPAVGIEPEATVG